MNTRPSPAAQVILFLCAISCGPLGLRAADHRDGTIISSLPAVDINDVYFFLDPNDNNRAIVSMTLNGGIIPSEAVNQAVFHPDGRYQFQIEGTGDAIFDAFINVTFSARTSVDVAQNATVQMFKGATKIFDFVAPATNPSLNATPPSQVITTDQASGVKFFAGEVDDPFFFDVPAFSRWVASIQGGSKNNAVFARGRDSFAGYNTMAICLSIPKTLLPNANNIVGLSAATFYQPTVLANLAARAVVEGGDKVLIAGKIISGHNTKRLIIRALGPSLAAFGLPGAVLSDPTLKLVDNQGQVLASNDNWQDSPQASEISSLGFAPKDPKESVILAALPAAAYTAIVDGAGGAKGIATVEVFDLENTPQVDRMGVPAVNVALVPFSRRDEYNASNPADDAAGRFASDIVTTLQKLGTDNTSINILANIAVTKGDILRLNLNTANTGTGGGTNSAAAFPNGRRPKDDTIDTVLTLINNRVTLSDNVNSNDVSFQDGFPFFANPQQPRDSGIDDNTRN
ncbi:MAG: DUF4331 family protein [Chthoniobacterales bacterium]